MFRTILTDRIVSAFRRPRRRAISRNHTVNIGLECLEQKQLLSGTGWEPGLNFERESNDTRATADTLAVTTGSRPDADVVITGGIRSVSDVDYYEFTLHSRADVQLDLYKLHPDRYEFRGDLDLRLEHASGTTLAQSIRAGGRPERIETTLDAGTYFARVYPYDSSGFGESYQVRLQTDAVSAPVVPATSTVTGPSDTSDATPTFTWTRAANATRYELWVYNRDVNARVIHNLNITSTQFTPTSDIPEGRNHVWVRAWNGSEPGRWSLGHAFDLQGDVVTPGVSNLTGPTDTRDATPEFRWTEAENATHYELWVSNRSIGRRVLHEARVESTRFTPDGDLPPGQHLVWVRAWNGNQAGNWSSAYSFVISPQSGVATPTVTGPGDTADSTPTFRWTQSAGATHYELWVSNRTTGTRAVYESAVQGTSFTPASELASGNHTVWVRAWNGSTRSDWSAPSRFVLTASANPDPNGTNNVRTDAISLPNRSTTDRLTSADETDYYFVSASARNPQIRFSWTVEVTSGNLSDIALSLEDGRGTAIPSSSYSVTRSGNRITLSTGNAYLLMRLRGYRVNLKLQLLPGASDISYRVTNVADIK